MCVLYYYTEMQVLDWIIIIRSGQKIFAGHKIANNYVDEIKSNGKCCM